MRQERTYSRARNVPDFRAGYVRDKAQEKARQSLPYWANYLLRTFVVLFLLLFFYLFGLCNPKGQQQIKEYVKAEFHNNASLSEAYDTYRAVDYEDMLAQLRTYVKAKLN